MKSFGILVVFVAMVVSLFMFLRPGEGPQSPTAANAPALVEKARGAANAAEISNLMRTIQNFKTEHERLPQSLQELVDKGYLDRVPHDVAYDPATGQLSIP
jgi:competence protein ComGC